MKFTGGEIESRQFWYTIFWVAEPPPTSSLPIHESPVLPSSARACGPGPALRDAPGAHPLLLWQGWPGPWITDGWCYGCPRVVAAPPFWERSEGVGLGISWGPPAPQPRGSCGTHTRSQ